MPIAGIPDIIADHLEQHSVNLLRLTASSRFSAKEQEIGIGHRYFVTPEVQQAFIDMDGAKIQKIRDAHNHDLKANMDLIKQAGADAFLTVTNPSDGKQYKMCASDNGWIWTFNMELKTDNMELKTDDNSKNHVKATVSCGSFSKTNKVLGLSTDIFHNLAADITDFAVSTMLANGAGTFIKSRLAGKVYTEAIEAAAAAASDGIENFAELVPMWTVDGIGLLGGLFAGVVASIALLYILDLIHMRFGLTINVYNWSENEQWDVVGWYADNAIMKDPPFARGNLPPASNYVKMPDGSTLPSANKTAYFAAYTVVNVLYLKYVVRWGLVNNKLGLGNDANQSIADFYKDDSTWASSDSTSTSITIPASGGLPAVAVSATTPSLSGDKDHFYTYDVCFGLPLN
ncbi:hypothetical protein C0995_012415 [Termitomyces sp. Mi166|nr:hypothetical protein C0995_012415 [Termitomyces sp. Mi166\